jgi:Na+/H+ antiporter NhaD/arsenite permease-like protein
MSNTRRIFIIAALMLGISLALLSTAPEAVVAQSTPTQPYILGYIFDAQEQPVAGAEVTLFNNGEAISSTTTQPDGRYAVEIPETEFEDNHLHIERSHFESATINLESQKLEDLKPGESIVIPNYTLPRHISLAFWIAGVVFVIVLILIATGTTHNTLAALMGASLLLGISYLGHPVSEELFIFDFDVSMSYIDWNVIFLIMGMMMVIAIVEHTGIFQWMAFFAYKISRGRMLILLPILMLITGIASAFLDNVTTMLLMTPITVQIAIAIGVNPLALLMPEVMASNVIGVSTLVGTPTNILIGSYGNITFNGFLQNLTPGVLLAFVGLVVYSWLIYRKDLAEAHETSDALLKKLEERGQITQPDHLKKAGWVGAAMLFLFVLGEQVHLLPSVTALIGATSLLLWIRPNIEEMIEAVDWTTLVFFMTLFMVVGAIQEVGLISIIAGWIGSAVGDSLLLSMIAVTFLSAILSMVIANIPFTAAMLPVIGFLSATVPGAESKVLFFCLSIGSAMGGNGTLIGASANMVTAGIAEAAGYKITYTYFLKKGLPAVLITVSLAFIWLLIRFL